MYNSILLGKTYRPQKNLKYWKNLKKIYVIEGMYQIHESDNSN